MFIHLLKHFHFNHTNTEFYNTHSYKICKCEHPQNWETPCEISKNANEDNISAQNSYEYRKNTIVPFKDFNKANMTQGNKKPQAPSAQGTGWEGVREFIQRLDTLIIWSTSTLQLLWSETKLFLWLNWATCPPPVAIIVVCTKTPWVHRAPPGCPRWIEGEKQLEEQVPEKGQGAGELRVPHGSQPAQKSTHVRTGEPFVGKNWPPNVLPVNKSQLIHHSSPLKCVKIHCISWTIQLDRTCRREDCSTPEISYRPIRTTAMLNPLYSLLHFFVSHVHFLVHYIHVE